MQITRKTNVPQRIVNVGIALVLAISTVSASLLALESQRVTAAPGVTATGSGFNALNNWRTDRSAPSGGVTQTNSTLTVDIDGDNGNPSTNAFYWTEGRQADLSASTDSIKATLFVDADWQNVTGVRAGMWGVTTASPLLYPIIEFSNRNESNTQLPGTARFQVWTSASGWHTVATPVVYDQGYTLEILYNDFSAKYEFYINDSLVFSEAAAYGPFSNVIFNHFNAHLTGNDYTAEWKNFVAGDYSTAAPVNLTPTTGTVTNNHAFQMGWDVVDGATIYEYRTANVLADATTLGPIIYSDDSTSSNYSISGNRVIRGNNGTPDNDYYWQVRAGNGSGTWTPWSQISKVTVDKIAPAVPVLSYPANNSYINTNAFYFDWNDVAGAVSYEAQFSQSNSTDVVTGSLNVGVWSGDAGHNQPTESRAWSSGANGTWYWQVRSVDAAGNKSAWTTPHKMTIDMVAPTAPTLASPADSTPINGAAPIANDWNSVSDAVRYIYQSYNVKSDGTCNLGDVRWTADYTDSQTNSRTLADGLKYCWRVKAVDAAGNESVWSALWKTVVDNSDPIVTYIDYTAVDNVITPNITVDDASLPLTYAWSPVDQTSVDNVDISALNVINPEFTVNVDGTYSFELVVTDTAGNKTTQLFTFTYTTPIPEQEPVTNDNEGDGNTGDDSDTSGANAANTGGFTGVDFNDGIVPEANDEDVLGVESSDNSESNGKESESGEVLGSTTEKSDGLWSPLGIVWYWWLLILVGTLIVLRLFVALVRRLRAEEA